MITLYIEYFISFLSILIVALTLMKSKYEKSPKIMSETIPKNTEPTFGFSLNLRVGSAANRSYYIYIITLQQRITFLN